MLTKIDLLHNMIYMKSVFIEIPWNCPHCKQETEIMVEVESPSDYMSDNFCGFCSKEIKSTKLDEKILNEVADAWVNN